MGKSKMSTLMGSETRLRSWRPSERTKGITAEVAVDTYVVIEAIYVLEFSFGFDGASVVCPMRGDLSVKNKIIDSRKRNRPC